MYNPSVLIISKRKELSIRYKKILNLLSAEVTLVDNLYDAIGKIKDNEFEFIIISDTIEENIKDFIKKVRILTYNFRPTIIAVSKSSEIDDRLDLLNAGADDILSEAMQTKEFQARINAHIRRHVENLTNPITNFLNEKLTRKMLKQLPKINEPTSLILVSVEKINYYREIYGEIATEKVFQTLGAIITSALSKEDAIGHYSQNEFIIFTNPYKAEKLAEFFAFAFDNVLKRFYTEYDFSNNFLMISTNTKEEKKVSLMKLIEAVVEYSPEKYKNDQDIIQSMFNLLKPLKNSEKSTYIIERIKLYGKVDNIENNKILIMEKDEALSLLIETSCIINGYNAKICDSYENFKRASEEFEPNLIILDYGSNNEAKGLETLKEIKEFYKNKKAPIVIFSTNILDKKNILAGGADFYLPKPYDIQTLIKTIKEFLS